VGLVALVAWVTIASAASKQELLVSAAISLKESLQEIGARFERDHPDVKVVFNFGASGVLQQQIEQGAPVDVYVSAALKQMDDLEAKGLILPKTRHTVAVNVVVLITPDTSRFHLVSLNDLTRSEVKLIAIGNPRTVPAGEYARAILTSLGLWDILQPKLILTENVRQALAYVTSGEVDAALVYATDAQSAGRTVRVVAVAPEGSYLPVLYPIAAIKASSQPALAGEFVDLALSKVGQQILKAHGFLPTPNTPTR
jgi:molybdate transport system substrate-binding protein